MTVTETLVAPTNSPSSRKRVVYLLGAGATHGCAAFRGSTISLVMPGLIGRLSSGMKRLFEDRYSSNKGIERLVNDVVNEDTDFEHLITFLDDAPSGDYRKFAADLKEVFSTVLRDRLDEVREQLGDRHSDLYAALIDMHDVEESGESLGGFMTLNYDVYLEHAIEALGYQVDFGVHIQSERSAATDTRTVPVLKLHGSFGWTNNWPIRATADHSAGLWIPPGIRKAKTEYPFNAIWGHARELLDCDIVRVIGCNLGPNDWDLVSLLFTTMHTHGSNAPYAIEVIAHPGTAERIRGAFPYLDVRSILEIEEVGDQIVAELLAGKPRSYESLDDDERTMARKNGDTKIGNPFEYWLRLKGEVMNRELRSLETPTHTFEQFVESTS